MTLCSDYTEVCRNLHFVFSLAVGLSGHTLNPNTDTGELTIILGKLLDDSRVVGSLSFISSRASSIR